MRRVDHRVGLDVPKTWKSPGPARNGFLLHLFHVDEQEICIYRKISGRGQMEQKYAELFCAQNGERHFQMKRIFCTFLSLQYVITHSFR